MELDPSRTRGKQARASVRGERSSGKGGEIDDESEEQDFALERHGVPVSPMAVQPKHQPTGNDDRAEDENRNGKTAIRKKRIDEMAQHIGRSLVDGSLVLSGQRA